MSLRRLVTDHPEKKLFVKSFNCNFIGLAIGPWLGAKNPFTSLNRLVIKEKFKQRPVHRRYEKI
jgi:hypothetical protein